jgi:hypothetical protein
MKLPTSIFPKMSLALLLSIVGCSSKKPIYFPEGNGAFWIDYTHGGPHWAMCGPYRDSDSYSFHFKDSSLHYSKSNMVIEVNLSRLADFEGSVDIDHERKTISIAVFTYGSNNKRTPLPINGRYPLREKK